MTTLSASLRLRPTRIGFLVRPTDKAAVRRIMRLCSCLWGGVFNPIIPVTRTLPRAWRSRHGERLTGVQLTAGYLRFFEPDVYVEASPGLVALAGIQNQDGRFGDRTIVALDDFVSVEDGRRPQVAFGLEVFEVYRDLYNRAYRFVPRDEHRIALVKGTGRAMAFAEAVFGGFPDDERLSHIPQGFVDAFDPTTLEPTAENWIKVVREGFRTPLQFTGQSLDVDYRWPRDPTLFVMNPSNPLDLIDFWNLRLFRRDVLPLNLDWLPDLTDFIRDFVERTYRPLPGNPHGVMISTTVEFARSIDEGTAKSICGEILSSAPQGSWAMKPWCDSIWHRDEDDLVVRPQRALVTAATARLDLAVAEEDENSVRFTSVSPEFAERFGGTSARWANVLTLSDYGQRTGLALVLPSRLVDPHRNHIRLGMDPLVTSREGWVLLERYKDHGEYLRLLPGREAITGWLRRMGIEAGPSDPGRVADQVLASVRGFWGTHILADAETLRLLDKMAKSVRRGPEGTIEEYPDRTAPVQEWQSMLARRAARRPLPKAELDDFVRAGALRLGLEVTCPNCEKKNWYGLSDLAGRVECMRCLQKYDFPQGSLCFRNTPWQYRVAGPYSVPDFAGGAYATVLTLRTFARGLSVGDHSITYSTNLDFKLNGTPAEADFALWYRREQLGGGIAEEPAFVVGEAKSFAYEAIRKADVDRLQAVGNKLPGTFLVFSVLKDSLSDAERKRVSRLALWGRIPLPDGRPRAPVIVLTGSELFAEHYVEQTWKELGGTHAALVQHASVRIDNLQTLADLRQQLYLGLPSYWSWLEERRKRRSAKTDARTTGSGS